MGRHFSLARCSLPAAAVCVGAAALLIAMLPGSAAIAAPILAGSTAAVLVWNWRLRHLIARVTQQMDARADSTAPVSLEQGIAALEGRLAEVDHRLSTAHPVSGLPMREALLSHIGASGGGILGAIAFADFERLTAFDPAMGERVFATLVARLRKMVPENRFLAQVDRGHVGIWFGEAIDLAQARAELDAISYALGDAIPIDARAIVPQVRLRLARFCPDDGLSAAAFLARTLASFALAQGMAAHDLKADPVERARDRYDLEQDLRQAIARRELMLEFQPLIDAGQRRVCGAEALLRWCHPERGLVPPLRFVPVMEAMGLASEIGSWVLNAAAREAAEWQAAGLHGLRMAVNVSGLQLERDDLPVLVERTLQRHELGASALEIELTESVATSDAAHCRRIFQQLRTLGVKLAVDDFGTGYSGFSSLRTLAFDKIKIDREFVTDVDSRSDSQAICQSIIVLARGLGIQVLAEGVERHAEYDWLRRAGCSIFQGYYFSRPLDSARFGAFVRDRERLAAALLPDGERKETFERLRA